MITVSARKLGRLFGLGIGAISAFACAGSAFKGSPDEEPSNNGGTLTDAGKASKGGTSTAGTSTGGVTGTADGGATTFEAQPRPRAPLGGSGVGGNRETGGAGSATAGSGGNVVDPPEEGGAGEPNVPEPPADSSCPLAIAEAWTAPIDSAGSNWHVQFGDPRVDVANHRLVVSYDDVASPIAPYQGGYYVKTEVTLEGGTVLAPYPHATEMRWPSLRRSSSGGAVELGATKYGTSEIWTTNEWPGFSGTSIAGAKTVTLTTYVKASTKALAVKVSYGAHTYRSGWISGFTWPETNLGILRYVGENNSRVYSGDAVFVGPLSGCQKLSDAAVEAAFRD